MPSTSETGQAKNVANFEDLISFCNGYGATYNPSKDALTIAKLQDLQTNAKASLQQTKTAKQVLTMLLTQGSWHLKI